MKKKIIIIDDHPLFRESTKQMVDRLTAFEVVGMAGDAKEGEQLVMSLKPDLAIVDLSLPDKSGLQLTRTLTTLLPELKVVIVSMHTKIDYIIKALRAGALGYVVKDSVAKSLNDCLQATINGEYFLDPALSQEIAPKLIDVTEEDNGTNSAYGDLSPREQEVFRLLAKGMPTKEIADKLTISTKTVANHRMNIMTKLDLHNTAALVHYAAKLGLLGDVS